MEKVEIGNCTLWHGDCREILPEIAADVLISDPVWPNCPDGLLQGSDNPHGLLSEAFAALPTLPTRAVIVMRGDSDPRFLTAVPQALPFFRGQNLPYAMPGYFGRKLGGDEVAYSFGEPIPVAPGKRVIPGRGPVAQPNDRRANGHPCSRPLVHFLWLVSWWSVETDTILDPFMGSGTTGAAATEHGRRFVGIEIERKFFDLACKRLDLLQDQLRLAL